MAANRRFDVQKDWHWVVKATGRIKEFFDKHQDVEVEFTNCGYMRTVVDDAIEDLQTAGCPREICEDCVAVALKQLLMALELRLNVSLRPMEYRIFIVRPSPPAYDKDY